MLRGLKAQSTLEYVIILTAIIAVIVVVAGGVLRTRTQSSMTHVSDKMLEQVQKIGN